METKGEFPLLAFAGSELTPLAEAFFELNHLKQLYRQGWLRRGVPAERCETVAEHVFSMAILAWWVTDNLFPQLDRDRVIRMVMVHELGEIYTGDITPADEVLPGEKYRLEFDGLRKVVDKLPNGKNLMCLWEEFEAEQTPEARFVRQIDRLEMAFQAAVYEKQGLGDMSEFFITASQTLVDPILQDILADLEKLRG